MAVSAAVLNIVKKVQPRSGGKKKGIVLLIKCLLTGTTGSS